VQNVSKQEPVEAELNGDGSQWQHAQQQHLRVSHDGSSEPVLTSRWHSCALLPGFVDNMEEEKRFTATAKDSASDTGASELKPARLNNNISISIDEGEDCRDRRERSIAGKDSQRQREGSRGRSLQRHHGQDTMDTGRDTGKEKCDGRDDNNSRDRKRDRNGGTGGGGRRDDSRDRHRDRNRDRDRNRSDVVYRGNGGDRDGGRDRDREDASTNCENDRGRGRERDRDRNRDGMRDNSRNWGYRGRNERKRSRSRDGRR
jgi:hypothetical protein